MPNHARVAKALALLLASMTIGATVLMLMGHNPPSAGPFSLSTYYRLDSVQNAVFSWAGQSYDYWDGIKIYYSNTNSGNIEILNQTNSTNRDLYHFCICNGNGGNDGQIQISKNWQNQLENSESVIRVCIIADEDINPPTDSQIKRLQILVDELCRKYKINYESVSYPLNWL